MNCADDEPEVVAAAGKALLETVRHVLTGAEIEACEWTQTPDFMEDHDWLQSWFETDEHMRDEMEDEEFYASESRESEILRKLDPLDSLRIQYSREIAHHIDEANRTASRRAVETHNRLHAA